MKRKKKELLFYVITIASCLIAMTIVVIAALLIYDKIIEDKAVEKEQELAQQVAADPEVISYSQEEVDMMLADAIATTESSTRQQVSSEILDSLQASLESGTTMVESLRPIYKDKIVVVSNKEYHFVPIDRSLKQSTLVQENLQVLETVSCSMWKTEKWFHIKALTFPAIRAPLTGRRWRTPVWNLPL